jgi:hypothetical protein
MWATALTPYTAFSTFFKLASFYYCVIWTVAKNTSQQLNWRSWYSVADEVWANNNGLTSDTKQMYD